MSDPINLNQSSPGALSTGAPPKVQVPLKQPGGGAPATQTNILPPQGGNTIVGGGSGGGSGQTLAPTQAVDFSAAVSTIYPCDPGAGNINAALPSAAAAGAGSQITPIEIKNITNNVGTVTVVPNGGDTIDGVAGSVVLQPQQSVRFVSNGVSNWMST